MLTKRCEPRGSPQSAAANYVSFAGSFTGMAARPLAITRPSGQVCKGCVAAQTCRFMVALAFEFTFRLSSSLRALARFVKFGVLRHWPGHRLRQVLEFDDPF